MLLSGNLLIHDVMKIFSNFDTKLDDELYRKEVEKFGETKVMLIHRDSIYVRLKIVFPGIMSLLIIAIAMTIQWKLQQSATVSPIITTIGMVILVVLIVIWLSYTIRKITDYYMDFAIITPRQIVSYQQGGLFRRSSISLDLTNLRSINEEKN
jgi:sterol desaturase/sphingolipid hydroxylase (fatty acid hydroxylase superfamily)